MKVYIVICEEAPQTVWSSLERAQNWLNAEIDRGLFWARRAHIEEWKVDEDAQPTLI